MIEQHKQTMNLGKNGEFREEWQLMSDVTQRSSDWSRAGEIPAEDVRGWTPWLQLGVVCVCVCAVQKSGWRWELSCFTTLQVVTYK